ncbi:hypothetical protein Nepgr_032872 [Nepenthes gracilis]|uniref:Uncharacterized protein n=1 Tax=Nepenthes gracilis TaxID=150966 RepID=A0AAD3TKV2_NEPGR|nr:hypothetical protein Nepgr_032872 [Nepenthes gracilis]
MGNDDEMECRRVSSSKRIDKEVCGGGVEDNGHVEVGSGQCFHCFGVTTLHMPPSTCFFSPSIIRTALPLFPFHLPSSRGMGFRLHLFDGFSFFFCIILL